MNQKLQAMLNLFNDNFTNIKDELIWQQPMAKRLAALTFALAEKPLDAGAIISCHKMIKNRVGVFSNFKGAMSVYVAAALVPTQTSCLMIRLKCMTYLKSKGFGAAIILW